MIVRIDQKVSIDPKYLDSNISHYILEKIRLNMENKCTLKYGYIINVRKIINLGDNIIAPANSLVVYDVTYEAETVKPEKGLELSGKICMVFEHGIFVDVLGRMKVLVPVNTLEGYTFSDDSFIPLEEKGEGEKEVIVVGKSVNIRINMVKYEKKEFSCIGELVKVNT